MTDTARDIRLARRYNAGAKLIDIARMEHTSFEKMRARLLAIGLVTIRQQKKSNQAALAENQGGA